MGITYRPPMSDSAWRRGQDFVVRGMRGPIEVDRPSTAPISETRNPHCGPKANLVVPSCAWPDGV